MKRRHRRPPGGRFLGEEGERAWQELRSQQEWASRFWLVYVFSASSAVLAELQHRSRQEVTKRGADIRVERPRTAAQLRALVDGDFIESSLRPGRQLWIEALRTDADGLADTGWDDAWRWVLRRLNERREALRERGGGLLLALPPALKAMARESAPDLWSIRSLSLEFEGQEASSAHDLRPAIAARSSDIELSIAQSTIESAFTDAKAAKTAAAAGQWAKATEHARRAVSRSDPSSTEYSDALTLLAGIEMRAGDNVGAARHMEDALANLERILLADASTERLLRYRLAKYSEFLGIARASASDRKGALAAFEASIRWSEPRAEQSDRELVLLHAQVLARASRMQRLLGAPREAESLAQRAITELRALANQSASDVKQVLAVALFELGVTAEALGRWQVALDTFEEALSLLRDLRQHGEEAREPDLAVLLYFVARVAFFADDRGRAREAVYESLAVARLEIERGTDRRALLVLTLGLKIRIFVLDGFPEVVREELAELLELAAGLREADGLPADHALIGEMLSELVEELDGKIDEQTQHSLVQEAARYKGR